MTDSRMSVGAWKFPHAPSVAVVRVYLLHAHGGDAGRGQGVPPNSLKCVAGMNCSAFEVHPKSWIQNFWGALH